MVESCARLDLDYKKNISIKTKSLLNSLMTGSLWFLVVLALGRVWQFSAIPQMHLQVYDDGDQKEMYRYKQT